MGLRVLLTNLFIAANSGSECVVESLADGLRQAGHHPLVYAPQLGPQAERMAARGHVLVDRVAQLGALRPDVIHAQHGPPSLVALANWPDVPAVNVTHGALGQIEAPLLHPQVRRTVAVDELVADRCRRAGVPAGRLRIILNAVDTSRFQPRGALPARPRRALLLTKNQGHHEAVRRACGRMGLRLDALGPGTRRISTELERELPQYDLVFATARMALEAAAVGCAVVVVDGRGFAGPLTEERLDSWRRLNFGATLLSAPATEDRIATAIAAYDAADAARVTARIRQEARLEDAIQAYLAVYREAIAEGAPPRQEAANGLAALLDETLPSNTMRPWRELVHEVSFHPERARDQILRGLRERLSATPPPGPQARAWLLATARDSLAETLARTAADEMLAFDSEAAAILRETGLSTASEVDGSPARRAGR
jgi:hypothetical protein